MSYSWKFQHFVLNGVISFLAKIKLVKNPDEKRKDLLIQVTNYRIELRRLLSNIPFALLITFGFGQTPASSLIPASINLMLFETFCKSCLKYETNATVSL